MATKGLSLGDYVLATKYADGDPGDHYCIGYFTELLDYGERHRFMVVDGKGKPFRGNGFRCCERITPEEGAWMLSRFSQFKPLEFHGETLVGKSVWDWLAECRAELPSR